ncbi:hypothetical protein DPC56_05910 [Methanothermobacter tenebrarum]|uniref:Uncharacterized protein n=1 Tax=Methanothermobacter tenebrarum TaxID=680118 RepID=A0A328PEI1_9EURY|nr:hypothetical protein DPC56_05910 [Methanothermobacter tenebrarum]
MGQDCWFRYFQNDDKVRKNFKECHNFVNLLRIGKFSEKEFDIAVIIDVLHHVPASKVLKRK